MRGKPKKAYREVSKLHGATANFVSLVDAGANETPFTSIKSKKHGAKAMPMKKRAKIAAPVKKSHKTLTSKKKTTTPEVDTETVIAKMIFDGETFESETEVSEYIAAAEWDAEDVAIVQNADGDWEARPEGTDDTSFLKLASVETEDEGVTAFVGQREIENKADDEDNDAEEDESDDDLEAEEKAAKPGDDEEEEDEDEEDTKGKKKPYKKEETSTPLTKRQEFIAKRASERSKELKFSSWDAMFTKGNTLAKALSDGMAYDAVPPGYYEVQYAFNAAVSNIVSGEGMPEGTKQDALNKAAMDYAEIIGGLDTFFDAYVESSDETIKKTFDKPEVRDALSKWAGEYGDFVTGDDEAPSKVEKSASAIEPVQAAAIDYSKIGSAIAEQIAKAIAPLAEGLEGVSGTVEAMASRQPTKKAVDPEDTGNAGPRKVKTAAKADDAVTKMSKQIFG